MNQVQRVVVIGVGIHGGTVAGLLPASRPFEVSIVEPRDDQNAIRSSLTFQFVT